MTGIKAVDQMSKWRGFPVVPLDWLALASLLGLAPLLLVQAGNLWSRQHLQFFPFAWLAFVAFVILRGQLSTTDNPLRKWIGGLSIAIAVIPAVLALVAYSPWLAQIAFIGFATGWLLLRHSTVHWFVVCTWIGILAITVPLPMNLDERLIQVLQIRSSESASSLLDLLGITHLLLGNIIEIRTGKLFVDQACSGVDSLYALAAVTLILLVWQRRSFLISILVMVSVPCWAWFGNVLRLVLIAYCYDRFDVDLTHGWQHTLLGLTTFAIAFCCLMITQEMLYQVFRSLGMGKHNSNWVHTLYNWIVRWPHFSRDSIDKNSPLPETSIAASSVQSAADAIYWKTPAYCIIALLILLGLSSIGPIFAIGPWREERFTLTHLDRGLIEATFAKGDLPDNFGGMQITDFQVEQRDSDDAFGEFSAAWYFSRQGRQVVLSLDFPFSTFHALEVCYELTGHQILGGMRDSEHTAVIGSQFIREGELADQFGDRSYIYYMEFTANGKADKATRTVWERLFPRQYTESLFQLQLNVKNAQDLKDEDHSRHRQLLLEAQKILLPKLSTLN